MKVGRERIKGMVDRATAGGVRYYWQPNAIERKAGWTALTLPRDLPAAIEAARARNAEIDGWRGGGARPREVKRFVQRQTFAHVLDRYEAEVLPRKAANTVRVDRTALRRLRAWAGEHPWHWITRARVAALRDVVMTGVDLDGPGHAPAFHLLTTLRKVLGWWIRQQDVATPNPADAFGLAAPAPREHVWDDDAQTAFVEAAHALGWPSIALAFRIASYTGQRQADVIALKRSQWREVTIAQLDRDEALHDALASPTGPDKGRAMGVHVRQGKTKAWVGVPVEGDLRSAIEAAIAANARAAAADARIGQQSIVTHDRTGRAWGQSDFIHRVAEIRDAAVAVALMRGEDDLADRMDELTFMDLRRTCIVNLGKLGLNDYTIGSITGHSQATIKRILEVYMPRLWAAAARGVVARITPASSENSEFRTRKIRNATDDAR